VTSDAIEVASEQAPMSPNLHGAYNASATANVEAPVSRVGLLLGLFIASVELVLFVAATFGALLGVGALLHQLHPGRHFDVFYVLHRTVVDGALIAICAVWLLPPYPWSKSRGRQSRYRSTVST
jgi:hypothetical protein